MFFGFIIVVLAVSLGLARRNAKVGRADRKGAFRGAVLMAIVQLTSLTLWGQITYVTLAITTAGVAGFWVFYMALEPYVRRFWPEILVGWHAVLSGRVRDPVVGRDLLAGTVSGVVMALSGCLTMILRPVLGWPPEIIETAGGEPWANLRLITGGAQALGYAVGGVFEGLLVGLPATVVLVLFVAGLKGRRWLGAVALYLLTFVVFGVPYYDAFDVVRSVVGGAVFVGLLSRFGLLALVTMYPPMMLLGGVALRFDAPPYTTASYVVVGVVGAIASYGLHTALGGKSLFGDGEIRGATAPTR